jgi:hypothetical protein
MNPAEIDALVASVQAAKASGQPIPAAAPPDEPDPAEYGIGPEFGAPAAASNAYAAALGGELPLGLLLDLSLPVSIELGRTSMTVQEILRPRAAAPSSSSTASPASRSTSTWATALRRGRGGGAGRALRRAHRAHLRRRGAAAAAA